MPPITIPAAPTQQAVFSRNGRTRTAASGGGTLNGAAGKSVNSPATATSQSIPACMTQSAAPAIQPGTSRNCVARTNSPAGMIHIPVSGIPATFASTPQGVIVPK